MNQPKNDLKTILQHSTAGAPQPPAEDVAAAAPPAEGRGSVPRHRCPARRGKKLVTGYFSKDAHRQLKILASERDTSIQALLTDALNDLFAKHGKPPIA